MTLLFVGAAAPSRADGVDGSSPDRYIVELDPTAVSSWLARVGGDFGEALRVQAVKSRVVNAAGGDVLFDYGDLPYVAVETDDPADLAALDGVVSVKPDVVVRRMLDTSLGVINATSAQLETALSGTRADGSGQTVVVIDDGIQWDHPFFGNESGVSRVVYEACFNQTGCIDGVTGRGSAAHFDGDWHGTHVAGIAAGTQVRTGTRTFRGVARNADIVAIKVFDENGDGSLIDVDRALMRVGELIDAGLTTVSAVNMSLGASVFSSGTCDSFRQQTTALIETLRAKNVVTVVAAGNASQRTLMSWPACISGTLPVGASTTVDGVAWFSNVSQRLADVGVMAPGESICSSVPTALTSSGFWCAGGTSMAAPHVAGAVALLKQATSSATPTSLIQLARTTPTVINDTVRSSGTITGLERLDVSRALAATQLDTGTLTGVVRDATDAGVAVPLGTTDITLSLVPSVGPDLTASVVTDAEGRYTLTGIPVGTWNVTASVQGFPTTSPQSFTLTSGAAPRATVDVTVSVQTGGIDVTASALPNYPAPVSAVLTPAPGSPWVSRTVAATSDATGRVSISGVRPGVWDVTLNSGSFTSATQRLSVTSGVTVAATLTMSALTGSVALTITDDLASVPLADTTVTIEAAPVGDPSDRGVLVTSASTSALGVVVLPAVRIGTWRVTVSAARHDAATTTFTVSHQVTSSASVTLPVQRGSVTATVVFPGGVGAASSSRVVTPLAESLDGITTTLTFTPSGSTPWPSFTITDTVVPGGDTFNVPGVRPGTWLVAASATGYRQVGAARSVVVVVGEASSIDSLAMTPVPHVASLTPSSGFTTGGTLVTFSGLHLDDTTSVTFGGVAAPGLSTGGGTTLGALTPARAATGSVSVVITTRRGTAITSFLYTAPPVQPPVDSGGGGSNGGGGGVVGGGGGSGGTGGSTGADPAPVTASVAAPSRPGNSVSVEVPVGQGVLGLSFTGVASGGDVQVQQRSGEPPSGVQGLRLVGRYVDISALGVRFDQVEVCVPFTDDDAEALGVAPAQMRLLHFAGDLGRSDITTRVDITRQRVCGVTDSFSPFAIGVPATERIAGDDRYATAVALSSTFFPDGAATVYLASGAGFADALAAGAAAAEAGGPVLLTAPGALPAVVRAELVRLAPSRVVVVGGGSAVSTSIDAAVRAAVPRATVTRVQGANRYATAVEVSKRAFPTGAATVYVATGLSFPDALAGAAAAGRDSAPVLLVPGTSVPAVVTAELARLRPRQVVLLGGATALSAGVATAVTAAVPGVTVTRLQGADRYATAASVAGTFDRGSTVFAATGRTFPDALAGAAVAGGQRGPVIVVPDGVVPAAVTRVLDRLAPSRVVVLGGLGALSSAVELQLAAFLP